MRNSLVYDLPLRLFHWLFSALFLSAYIIAKTQDSESGLFIFHMFAGLTIGFLVVFRILWGLVGTTHSRWSSLKLNPRLLFGYFKDIFFSRTQKTWAGHNPASSWATIAMIGLAIGLVTTGYLMTQPGDAEIYEDVHELFANLFLVTTIFHVLGLVLHTIHHRDSISLSMIDGRKQSVEAAESISKPKSIVAVILLLATAVFVFILFTNYDTTTRTLQVFGRSLQLGDENDSDD